MNLSERIRPNVEAAPWVCGEVAKLEAERDRLREALQLLYDTCDAPKGSPKFEDFVLALRQAEVALQETEATGQP